MPFWIADNYAIDIHDLGAACQWYKEKLGLRKVRDGKDDSGRPFADVCLLRSRGMAGICSLVELEPGTATEKQHVIFYANNLEKTQQWLISRGVTTEPITVDSGGNRFFRFLDLDGNAIEVCVEPK
ncbi:MAG TPA: VOC family protein [Candidatus Acidoferrales bacterium]|nr:VOC family protein [Candidatus Acidoferrales bacterium]